MTEMKELLEKPQQKTWRKVQKTQRGEEPACVGNRGKKLLKKSRGNAENTY